MIKRDRTLIGRAERVDLPTLGLKAVPAKIDSGADASSIWCGVVELVGGELHCIFFAEGSPFYTGEKIIFKTSGVDLTRVYSSFGSNELRYKVKIPIRLKGRRINSTFTLTDRSTKLYPILIGRSTLQGKFIIDVRRGKPLKEAEEDTKKHQERAIRKIKKELNL